ncbi:MAG TPA: hypothetical protein DEP20_01655 [Fusobacteria bacterium]|nr:hypothetical protein [Fusobacteriota bacterium]|tara:strand:+ start:372 stop:1211 length:840 start_codon:yes stop_codon:yes gene_type:complete
MGSIFVVVAFAISSCWGNNKDNVESKSPKIEVHLSKGQRDTKLVDELEEAVKSDNLQSFTILLDNNPELLSFEYTAIGVRNMNILHLLVDHLNVDPSPFIEEIKVRLVQELGTKKGSKPLNYDELVRDSDSGLTPLEFAISEKKKLFVHYFIENKDSLPRSSHLKNEITKLIEEEDIDFLKFLFEELQRDDNYRLIANNSFLYSWTVGSVKRDYLYSAVKKGNLRLVEFFVEDVKIDVNKEKRYGKKNLLNLAQNLPNKFPDKREIIKYFVKLLVESGK